MGQIFHSTVYDIKNRTCSSYDADKFHSNCYSYSGDVAVVHYLLMRSAKNVMWYGIYSVLENTIEKFTTEAQLLGMSVNSGWDDLQRNNSEYESKSYAEKIKFIGENHNKWKHEDCWDEAVAYFDLKHTKEVRYNGFLINHTKKEAIDLKDYKEKSISMTSYGEIFLIDPIPPLTETGGGTEMALFDGCSAETTEHLVGHWCGDCLQIVEKLPEDYTVINCCFAEIWYRSRYCFHVFGTDKENFILKNDKGERHTITRYNPFSKKRAPICYVQVEKDDDGITFKPVSVEKVKTA